MDSGSTFTQIPDSSSIFTISSTENKLIVNTETAGGAIYGTYDIWYDVTVSAGSATVTQKFQTVTIKDKCSADGGLTVT